MKYIILLVSIFIIYNGYTQPRIIDGIIARVNNDIILKSDIDCLINDINPIFNHKKKYFYKNFINKDLLNQIILNQLISQYIKEKELKISENKINDIINHITKNFSNRENFFNYLISKNIDYEFYRDNLRKYLILSDLCNKNIYSRINILYQEVENIFKQIYFYNIYSNIEFNINYIFIPINKKILEKEINNLFLLVNFLKKNNNDFNLIMSNNPIYFNSFKIINTNWSKLNKLPNIFYEYLQNIQEGDIIGPILSKSGFYIIKINGIKNEKLNQKIEIRFKQIILYSSNKKKEKEIENYLKNIVDQIKNGKINFSIKIINLFKNLGYVKFNDDLNWYSSKNIDPNIYSILINLKKEEVSIPIFYNNKWNILQLIDIRQVNDIDSSYMHDAYRLILDYKMSQRIRMWINEKYVSTYIKFF